MVGELLDALLDTLKLMPWLLVMHVLIEVFEYHAVSKIKLNKVLRGPFAPLIGGACGILPQCGFGVVAADLYSRKSIRLGTMAAVFIATSDEAIPILLSAPTADSVVKLCVLLGFKFAAALVAGYSLNFILRKRELSEFDAATTVIRGCHRHELGEHTHEAHSHEHKHEHGHKEQLNTQETVCFNSTETLTPDEREHPEAEKTESKKSFDFKCFVVHPLLHTLTVAGYILAVNVLFAVILHFVGEQRLTDFLTAAKFYQPFLAGLVGLIPNCASSVILAQMFARGSITLGAAFAGLSVNAGLGLAVLLRRNRPVKNTFFIAAGLYLYSCVVGIALSFIPM
ncbi:MAG: arsenic efflux protein [Clostridia bacterium]|nr:arsenic efflux protein [Clostridia bacterium]